MDVRFLTSAFGQDQYPPPDFPEIAFAGRSNVGKSSLLNTLVNRRNIAKTSSRPGRTQAINFFLLDRKLYLVDLPGYGFAKVPIKIKRTWQKMVETYLKTRPNLKVVVVIIDIRRGTERDDLDLLEWLAYHGISSLVVLTKSDKLSRSQARLKAKETTDVIKDVCPHKPILFSAKTKDGLDQLWASLNNMCFTDSTSPLFHPARKA